MLNSLFEIKRIAAMILTIALMTFAVVMLVSCSGGGSSGTGGRRFEGTLRSFTNAPLSNVTVALGETGDSTVSDTNGTYVLQTDGTPNDVTYLFEGDGFSASVRINVTSQSAAVVVIDFQIDTEKGTATPTKIDEREDSNESDDHGSSSGDDDSSSSSSSSSGRDDDDQGHDDDNTGSDDDDKDDDNDSSSSSGEEDDSGSGDDNDSSSSSGADDDDEDDNSSSSRNEDDEQDEYD